MNMPAMPPATPTDDRPAAARFTFASGARPLEGYTIKRGVGRGGFGEVYFAVSDAGKEVALKLIRRNLDVELRGVTHCLNLKHPNLVALYDVRTDDQDNSWVIMEYVAGESLEDAIRRNPNGMSPAEALDWMRGIAAGVAYLHSHGIVHRDLKPANVFRDEGIVKLGDYGLSKFISCSRRSGQTESIGTVHYMAPEIANGRYGKEIDIYALGIVLFEMLTGRVPFDGESVGEVLMKHLTAEPDTAGLAEPYRTTVARSLAKDPEVRFDSVQQLMAGLPQGEAQAGWHGQPAAAAAVPSALVTALGADEPVWQFVQSQARRAMAYWKNGQLSIPTKVLLTVLGIFALLGNAEGWVKLMLIFMLAYGTYRFGRWSLRKQRVRQQRAQLAAIGRAPRWQQTPPPIPSGGARGGQSMPVAYGQRRETAATPLVVKAQRERLAELTGSMLFAAIVSLVLSVVMVLLRGQTAENEQYAWLTLTSTLGAWAILIPAKLWEGTKGEASLRRFLLLVVGLGYGAAAFGLDRALLVDLPFEMHVDRVNDHVPASFYSTLDGSPLLPLYMAYFGFLFLIVRWWRQADPLRPTRLSLWATACAVFAAWVLNLFWPFPQPWGLMVAAVMSITVQLASPWVPASERSGYEVV